MLSREEKKVQNVILLELGKKPYFRVWRNTVGVGYGMYIVRNAMSFMRRKQLTSALNVLLQAQPIKFGIPGQSDIFGIHSSGRFISIEVKAPGKLKDESLEQIRWGVMIKKFNGFYACVDSLEMLLNELEGENLLG